MSPKQCDGILMEPFLDTEQVLLDAMKEIMFIAQRKSGKDYQRIYSLAQSASDHAIISQAAQRAGEASLRKVAQFHLCYALSHSCKVAQ